MIITPGAIFNLFANFFKSVYKYVYLRGKRFLRTNVFQNMLKSKLTNRKNWNCFKFMKNLDWPNLDSQMKQSQIQVIE